jgi:carbon-monoxide dehydrogenase large subunit
MKRSQWPHETPSQPNPPGLKGVGESGTLPLAAVIATAVEDALSGRGLRVDRIPLTPSRLQRLLKPAGGHFSGL